MIQLLNGSCIDEKIINSLELNNENNVVITSPPYNMNLRIRNGKYCSRQIVKELTTKYKDFPDNLSMEEYFEFNKKVIETYLDFCPTIFYNVQFLTGNKKALFKLIGYFSDELKEVIVWDKVNAQPAIGKQVLNSQFEVILVFDKYNSISRRFNDAKFERGTMSNLWKIKRAKKKHKEHGAVFPEELVENIVKLIDKDSIIVDPFMGTGTTGRVAKRNNFDFIGIELDSDYYNYCKEELAEN